MQRREARSHSADAYDERGCDYEAEWDRTGRGAESRASSADVPEDRRKWYGGTQEIAFRVQLLRRIADRDRVSTWPLACTKCFKSLY